MKKDIDANKSYITYLTSRYTKEELVKDVKINRIISIYVIKILKSTKTDRTPGSW